MKGMVINKNFSWWQVTGDILLNQCEKSTYLLTIKSELSNPMNKKISDSLNIIVSKKNGE